MFGLVEIIFIEVNVKSAQTFVKRYGGGVNVNSLPLPLFLWKQTLEQWILKRVTPDT